MSEFEGHTPGPWKAFQWGDGSQDGTELWNVGCDEYEVVIAKDIPEPDARLIAAAPDLLAQLDALAQALIEIRDFHGGVGSDAWMSQHAAKALARVRGESSDE